MRVAVLYDIHGNLPALRAVLAKVDAVRPDAIVVGGDVVRSDAGRDTRSAPRPWSSGETPAAGQ